MSLQVKKKITFEDFKKIQNETDKILEYIDGLVYMAPSTSMKHQEISSFLHGELYILLKNKKCKVFSAPTDVILKKRETDEKKKVVPDLFVVCDPDGFTNNEYIGIPDLIIEILSPSNQAHDLVTKLNLYMKYGVKEYWIVNPLLNNIMIYSLDEKGEYQLNLISSEGTAKSNVCNDFEVKAGDLFS
ncbi:Uma2 family endonuclease [Virgibacillus sp. FSP13]